MNNIFTSYNDWFFRGCDKELKYGETYQWSFLYDFEEKKMVFSLK